MPPCHKDCPKRSTVCHDRKVCPDWGVYQDELKAFNEMRRRRKDAETDYQVVLHTSVRVRKKEE